MSQQDSDRSTQSGALEGPRSQRAPKTREEVVSSEWHRDLSTPKLAPGDRAYDFALPLLDPHHGLSSQAVRLSDYAGRQPVALVFGSYT